MAFEAGDYELGFSKIAKAKELGREPKTGDEARAVANYFGDAELYENYLQLSTFRF